jgi:hypothetical protein
VVYRPTGKNLRPRDLPDATERRARLIVAQAGAKEAAWASVVFCGAPVPTPREHALMRPPCSSLSSMS